MSEPRLLDPRTARALGHPLRRRILELLYECDEASPNEMAMQLQAPLSTLSYHVQVLRDIDCIELVRTEPRRGAVEHFYRATLDVFLDDNQWASLPVAVRRQLSGQTIGELIEALATAARTGGFDSPRSHLDRLPLRLDETGRAELSSLLTTVLSEAAEIQRRSDERASSDEIRPSQLTLLHFDRPRN